MAKYPAHILELAKKGAEQQYRDLVNELKLLVDLFPHLRDTFDEDQLPIRFILKKGSDRSVAKGARRRRMSAAARKAISERMKRSWAARRKAAKA